MISAAQRDRVASYLRLAVEEGGTFATGGSVIEQDGYWVQPTVVAGLDNSSRLAQEEIFGPVLVVIPHDGDDDAVRIANDSAYGLSGSVDSGSLERAKAVAARIPKGRAKIRDAATLDAALAHLGSRPHAPLARYDDHATDAILAAAWLRAVAHDETYWTPANLTPAITRTEGWTFGVK